MFKKSLAGGILIAGLLFVPSAPPAYASPVLGVGEEKWQADLKDVGGEYVFDDTFLSNIKDAQHQLENKYGSEHFEHLNSKVETLRDKHRKNSLLHRKPLKARSSFVIDLNLGKKEYNQLLSYIPALGTYYSERHIAQMLPYIAYCLNYDVKQNELNFYLNEFLKRKTPPDIACERLYRLAEGSL